MLSDIDTNSSFPGTDHPTSPIASTPPAPWPVERPRFEDSLFPPDAMARQRMLAEMLSRRGAARADDVVGQPNPVT